jgi:MarR family transcriptional regulator, temperature-dependent positive regulator of motility
MANLTNYLLTARGINRKVELTARFLQAKKSEYESLRLEIEQMRFEVQGRNQRPAR